jgi:hypothetical protein
MKLISQFNPFQPEPDMRFVVVAFTTILNAAVGLVYGWLTQNIPVIFGLIALSLALVGSRRSRPIWLALILAAQYGYWLLLFFVFK